MKKLTNSIVYFMKVTTLVNIVLVATSLVSMAHSGMGQSLDQRISLSFSDIKLSEALILIEKETGLDFVFSKDFTPTEERVSGDFEDETVKKILSEIFSPHTISGKRVNNQVVLHAKEKPNEEKKIQQGVGTVVGQVLDGANSQPLPGASVLVKGTSNGGVTDLRGKFRINNIPEGSATLVCSYLGYETLEEVVEIESNKVLTLNFEPIMDITGLTEVVITGNLEGQSRALNQQRTSDNIKNIISADLIGRFPDLNVGEALQRVPGINIARDNGEGGAVTIRGTPTNYTSIQVNGEQLPGNGLGGDRSPSLTLYTVDQLASIEVTKSITPDMDGDAIGGVVNMKSPTAKFLRPSLKLELGGGYNNLSKGVNGIGSLSYGRRFFPSARVAGGRLGVLAIGSYFRTDNGEDRTESQWDNRSFDGVNQWYLRRHDLRALQTLRTRGSAGLNLDYKFNEFDFLQFNFMFNVLREDEIRTRTRFRMDDGNRETPNFSSNSTVRKTYRDRVVNRDNYNYTLLGSFDLKGWVLEPGVFYTTTLRDENAIRGEFEAEESVDLLVEDVNTNYPQISGTNVSIYDATIFTNWNNYRPYTRANDNQNFVGKLSITKPFQAGRTNGLVKGGYKYRKTFSKRSSDWMIYEHDGSREDLYPRFADYNAVPSTYLSGRVPFGPGFNTSAVTQYYEANQGEFERQSEDEIEENALFFYDASETTHAGYLMGKMDFSEKVMLLLGLRYENISVNYDALNYEEETGEVSPTDGVNEYDFFLPNLQAKYSITNMTNLRFAAVRSFARPNFGDIVPSQFENVASQELTTGNPALLPPSAWNFDLKFERYLGNVGILSLSGFYKFIEDFQFDNEFFVDSTVTDFYPRYDGYVVTVPDNGEEAKVWGLEVNIQTNLSFLPGALGGLGLYLNYTFTNSEAFTRERSGIRLPGQADHTGNLALTYDYKGFSSRISVNFQDDLVQSLGNARDGEEPGARDLIRDSRYQIDINASQQINEKWRIYTEFINVSNQPQIVYFGSRDRIEDLGLFSWWCRFGVSYTL